MLTQSSNPSKVVEVKEVIIARRGKKLPERHRQAAELNPRYKRYDSLLRGRVESR